LGGNNNTLAADYSSILGGKNINITHDYAYAMGNNVDSVSTNTTHVDQLYAKSLPLVDPSVAGMLYTQTGAQLGLTASATASTFVLVSGG
jgi:UDP-glucose 6-dehydrogenase